MVEQAGHSAHARVGQAFLLEDEMRPFWAHNAFPLPDPISHKDVEVAGSVLEELQIHDIPP